MCVPEGHVSLLRRGPVLSTLLLSEGKEGEQERQKQFKWAPCGPGGFPVVCFNLFLYRPVVFSKINQMRRWASAR